MSKSELTVSEVIGGMTGYEEDAITKTFGLPIEDLDDIKTARALIFVVERRRDGFGDAAAAKTAQAMPRNEVMEYFTPSEEEPFPDEPVTAEGND